MEFELQPRVSLATVAPATNPRDSRRIIGDNSPQRLVDLDSWVPARARDRENLLKPSESDIIPEFDTRDASTHTRLDGPFCIEDDDDIDDEGEENHIGDLDDNEISGDEVENEIDDHLISSYDSDNKEELHWKKKENQKKRGQRSGDNLTSFHKPLISLEPGQEPQNRTDINDSKLDIRHITFSRDQTQASTFEKERLAALVSDRDNLNQTVHEPTYTVSNHGLQDYQIHLMLLEQQNKKRDKLARMETDAATDSNLTTSHMSTVTVKADLDSGRDRESLGFKAEQNSDRIAFLEEGIQRLRNQQKTLGSTTWHVFHRIEGEDSTYLTEPSWYVDQDLELRLRGSSPLADEVGYIRQRPDVSFMVHKFYEHKHRSKAMQRARTEGTMLPNPVPIRETIQLLSEQMISALDTFLHSQPTFKEDFPGWDSKEPIKSPFLFWYHYRSADSLQAISEHHRSQMHLLTGWIDQNYYQIYSGSEAQFARGYVSRSTLPFFVRPGEVLVRRDTKGIQGYIAESWANDESSPYNDQSSSRSETEKMTAKWAVKAWCYGFDGRFYRHHCWLPIEFQFDEDRPEVKIASLEVFPLRFASGEICKKLDHRGHNAEHDFFGQGERYMIDFNTYKQLHSDSPKFKARHPMLDFRDRQDIGATRMDSDALPEGSDLLVFPSTLIGYNLRQKKWQDLDIERVQYVSWNKEAFAHLVIDYETKDIIQALVTARLEADQGADLIQGKGNGLIMLLHGSPGTGKTFTAESVAEIAEKPLFRVTCGDIGTEPEAVEKYLESVLHLGKIWDCVVLLDEADVFLEQRTLTDLARNALVSVFLRVLEYYEGILILTSNRVGTFDEAFKSRIQLSLHYDTLDKSQRRTIWENFLKRLKSEKARSQDELLNQTEQRPKESKGIDFDDVSRHFGDLAEEEMNGRQIRNAITTSRQLAKFKDESMSYKHLAHVIKVSRRFDRYLERVRDNYTDDQLARGEGIR